MTPVMFRKIGTEVFAMLLQIRSPTDTKKCAVYRLSYKNLVYYDTQKLMQKSVKAQKKEYQQLLTEMTQMGLEIKVRDRCVWKDAQVGRKQAQKTVYTKMKR